ncbi:MAG TPA: hypothetical protein VLE44_00495 [Candidatus Saccharimonadales bacterium]|nr:hypothetical protein [Candidatus Saccharimonadales bacterium]
MPKESSELPGAIDPETIRTNPDVIRFCKASDLIARGPAEEIPEDVIRNIANLSDEKWNEYATNYHYETKKILPDLRPILKKINDRNTTR